MCAKYLKWICKRWKNQITPYSHTHWSIWLRLIHFEFLKCFSSVLLLLHKWIDCIELNTHVKRFDFKTIEKSHFKWWNVEWAHLFECMFGIDSERTFGISFLKSVLIYTNLMLELTQNISVESVLYIIGLCNVQVWIDLHTHGREWRKKQISPKEFERCNIMRRRNLNPKSKATLCQSHFSIEKNEFWSLAFWPPTCCLQFKMQLFYGHGFCVCLIFFSFKNPIFKLITVICACFMLNDNERKKNDLCSLYFFRTPIRQIGRTYGPIL